MHVLPLHGLHTLGQVHCLHPEHPRPGHAVHARVAVRPLPAEPGKRCARPESFLSSVETEMMVTILTDDNGDNECKGNFHFHIDNRLILVVKGLLLMITITKPV